MIIIFLLNTQPVPMCDCVQALDNNELAEVPAGVLGLPSLRELWLRQNRLTHLPDNLDTLTSLEVLSVSSNQLEELPECLSNILRYNL